jgi:phosphoribosyl-AMP cyclohydrolase
VKIDELNFNSDGLIPVIVQDAKTDAVLMMGWANAEAIRVTFDKRLATFWSRSRNELWTKGDTSGDRLHLVEVRYDCDEDVLLYSVELEGKGACHTGEYSCFYRVLEAP